MSEGFVNSETGWSFVQSQQQSFYMFENIIVDGDIGVGDGCVPDDFYSFCDGVECTCCSALGTCDVLGSFYNDTCVGWLYVDSDGFTTAAINGNDGDLSTASYPGPGDVVTFKLYDATYGTIVDLQPTSTIPGFQNNSIELILGDSVANNDLEIGCTDQLACNFDYDAILSDNGSCIYQAGELEVFADIIDNTVQLSWADPEGESPFVYYLNGDQVSSPLFIDQLNWSTDYSYTISVQDSNSSLCGLTESIVDFTISSEPLPNAITGLFATSSDGKILLDWDDVIDYVDKYSVSVFNSQDQSLLQNINTYESFLLHDNLLPNTTYGYQVVAVNSEGNIGISSDLIESTTNPLSVVVQIDPDPGQASIRLFWEIDEDDYSGDVYKFDIYQDGQYIYTTGLNTYLVNNLNPELSYCFEIQPKINADYLGSDTIEYGNFSNSLCAVPEQVTGWGISLSFNVLDWGENLASDINNQIGMHPDATNSYDPSYDIFEPPSPPGIFASMYFPHPEWFITLADNFTSDFKELSDLSSTLSVWDADFVSSGAGPAYFEFDFINDAGNWPVYFGFQNASGSDDFKYYNISDNNISNLIDFTYLPSNQVRSAQIIVGNSYPGPPIGLEAVGGPRKIDLFWSERPLCIFDDPICNDEEFFDSNENGLWDNGEDFIDLNGDNDWTAGIDNRYPATGYKIFKNTELEHLITLNGHEITIYLDQVYINDNEEDLELINQSTNDGEFSIDYYEVYSDVNMNGVFDESDTFDDCGLDNLCPDSQGYVQPDLGEGDGICNRFIKYMPNIGFVGEDILTLDTGQYVKDIVINVVDEMVYEYKDEFLLGSQLYNYYMIAYNHAGDSVPSSLVADITEQNIIPTSDAGLDQVYYLYEEGQFSSSVTLPLNEDGSNDNKSYDEDAFIGESLIYSWEKLDNDIWEPISDLPTFDIILDIGTHYFRHRVFDTSNMWSLYDSVTIDIRGLPKPAVVDTINVGQNLYYLELSWNQSQYCEQINIEEGCFEENWPAGYFGLGALAANYEIYVDDSLDGSYELLDTIDGNLDLSQESFTYVHNGLSSSTNYCYQIYGINVQGLRSEPASYCGFTGGSPSIEILSPNGGDILVSGSNYTVEWSINNPQYVESIEIFYSSGFESIDSPISDTSWQSIFFSDELIAGADIQIPLTDGGEITYSNGLKVQILDVGDYFSNGSNSYSDISDSQFIITDNILQHTVTSGINIIGSPLDPSFEFLEENLGLNDDNLGFWLAYDEYGNNAFESILYPGKGYYLVNITDGYFTLEGDILNEETIILNKGWNLISNPLVLYHDLENIKVAVGSIDEDGDFISNQEFNWSEASSAGFISPEVYGYDNQKSIHSKESRLNPFNGYWVHTTISNVALIFESYQYENSIINDSELTHDWQMIITASEESASNAQFSIKDYIIIGMDADADDSFLYGEDLYDIPAILNTKYTNLYINHSDDWFSSGTIDVNNVVVDSPRFMADIRRPIESSEDFKQWNISGELLGTINSSSLIRLDWSTPETVGVYPINLVVGDLVYDMRSVNSVLITGDEFMNFSVQMGNKNELSNNSVIVSDFSLTDPYPNPFNPLTSIILNVPSSDYINVSVYDIRGTLIDEIYDGYINLGQHNISWDASNMSSGVYFFKAIYQSNLIIKKSILIK